MEGASVGCRGQRERLKQGGLMLEKQGKGKQRGKGIIEEKREESDRQGNTSHIKRKRKAMSRSWKLLEVLEDVCMQCYDLQRKATAVL